MSSIFFEIETKSIYVYLLKCGAFKGPIMSWVSVTRTAPKGPKSEHDTRVKSIFATDAVIWLCKGGLN